jgi:hypothetical protein
LYITVKEHIMATDPEYGITKSRATTSNYSSSHFEQAAPASSFGDTTYTCPMHPDVVRSEPGRCPKCGMTLKPSKA